MGSKQRTSQRDSPWLLRDGQHRGAARRSAAHAEIVGRIPMGRWGSPEDLGGAAVFLAGSASDYVTGHVLAVDGGWLAR
nr:SDR family oxidoreductase [Kibdelosporangium persicum]